MGGVSGSTQDGPASDLAVDVRDGNVRFWVQASPGAKVSAVVGSHGDAVRVKLSAPPVDGKANDELLRLLRRVLGVPVTLVSGASSRRKRLEAEGLSVDELVVRLLG